MAADLGEFGEDGREAPPGGSEVDAQDDGADTARGRTAERREQRAA